MNVMIIGAGQTGTQLAKRLINEGNTVTVIDNDEELTGHLSNRLDCTVLCTDGNNLENLEEAGISKQDAVICVTKSDEVNIITCSLVNAVYPDILKIARVRKYGYYVNTLSRKQKEFFSNKTAPLYGVDVMINPDVEAANAIVNAVNHGAISDILSFGKNNEYEITSLQVETGSKLDGFELKKIRELTDKKFVVAFHERYDQSLRLVKSSLPSGETVFAAGDRIGFISRHEDIPEIMDLCGTKFDRIKKILMFGIGRIGMLVADRLIEKEKNTDKIIKMFSLKKASQSIVMVDSDKNLTKTASERYSSARVLNGDISDEGFIEEEKLNDCDLMICSSDNHELNMIVSAYFESLGVERTISLVSHSQFENIARKIGVDVAIPMRDTFVDAIISHLHGNSVKGIHSVSNGNLEIIECDIVSTSKISGKKLMDFSGHGDYLVLLIRKSGSTEYEIVNGHTILSSGDHIVFIQKTGDKKIMEMFTK